MGEHLDLGHTLFVVAALPPLILPSLFTLHVSLTGALLQQLSQMKEQLSDPFLVWLLL